MKSPLSSLYGINTLDVAPDFKKSLCFVHALRINHTERLVKHIITKERKIDAMLSECHPTTHTEY
jgi:hypothetical protein